MSRIALFFDGKAFASGLSGRKLDWQKLATWLVDQAGGTELVGAHYFTGVEVGEEARSAGQLRLAGFLRSLSQVPGFFVHRYDRAPRTAGCDECGAEWNFTEEKGVDVALGVQMVQMALRDEFDTAVLLSGDADFVPVVQTLRGLGKRCFVASWGGAYLSGKLRAEAFGHIDLNRGTRSFSCRSTTKGCE